MNEGVDEGSQTSEGSNLVLVEKTLVMVIVEKMEVKDDGHRSSNGHRRSSNGMGYVTHSTESFLIGVMSLFSQGQLFSFVVRVHRTTSLCIALHCWTTTKALSHQSDDSKITTILSLSLPGMKEKGTWAGHMVSSAPMRVHRGALRPMIGLWAPFCPYWWQHYTKALSHFFHFLSPISYIQLDDKKLGEFMLP